MLIAVQKLLKKHRKNKWKRKDKNQKAREEEKRYWILTTYQTTIKMSLKIHGIIWKKVKLFKKDVLGNFCGTDLFLCLLVYTLLVLLNSSVMWTAWPSAANSTSLHRALRHMIWIICLKIFCRSVWLESSCFKYTSSKKKRF